MVQVASLFNQLLHHFPGLEFAGLVKKHQADWPLFNLATMLRLNLFTFPDLLDWLQDLFGTPPIFPAAEQLQLALA